LQAGKISDSYPYLLLLTVCAKFDQVTFNLEGGNLERSLEIFDGLAVAIAKPYTIGGME